MKKIVFNILTKHIHEDSRKEIEMNNFESLLKTFEIDLTKVQKIVIETVRRELAN